MSERKSLLFIIEQGGYPVYSDQYSQAGFDVITVQSMRKALSLLKREQPDVICTEMNVDPNFRDRISNLEPLLARLQTNHPQTKVIVFMEQQHLGRLEKLRERYQIFDALLYPLQMEKLIESLKRAVASVTETGL